MVKKNAFMLSHATLMLAPYGGTPVFDLSPDDHSVGLAKEVAVNVDVSNIDLTAGIAQAIVDTKRSSVQTGITAMVQEYTAQNLMYAQGLSGTATQVLRGVLSAQAAGGAVSLSITSDPIPGESASAIPGSAGAIPTGATLLIQHPDNPDLVFPTRSSAASTHATGTHTVAIADPFDIPTGMTFPIGSKVWVITEMGIGSTEQSDLFSVKIAGTLSNFNRPMVAIFPKVSIMRGLALSFSETEYGAMPFELRPLLLNSTEATGRLAEIGTKAPGRLYAA